MSAVHDPVAVSVWVNVTRTLSVTVTPDVTNCQVPVQSPAIIGVGPAGVLELLPHPIVTTITRPSTEPTGHGPAAHRVNRLEIAQMPRP